MRFLPLLVLASQLAAANAVTSSSEHANPNPVKRDDNGYTKAVSWDKYSLTVNGQRIFVHGGEFHPFRLPVPDLWTDVFQKYKAAGLNTVSIYFHWGLSNPSKGVLDFDGVRALQPLLDAAKEIGLWVRRLPQTCHRYLGPYINAETSAGGMPHWVTAEVPGYLRTNSSSYTEAYTPYWEYMAEITAKNQITAGGPIILIQIDNEYVQYDSSGGNPGKAGYFDDLQKALRKKGVVIPTTYNDPGMNGNFVSGEGKVDIYGIDSYTGGFDCRIGAPLTSVATNYNQYHVATNPSQPLFIPEFQSGSIEPWGPTSVGYERCRVTFGSDYESLFNINLWANNVKMVSYYMAYGGTSWGHIPFHKVYTSYDYGAAIAENRWITPKYQELKRQGLFLRSAKEFITTDVVGNSTDSAIVPVTNSDVYVTYLKNPTTGAGFYIARHADSTSNINLPNLSSGWKYFDSLPEIKQNYSDKGWSLANKKTTNSPFKPYYGDSNGPILYGCEYKFCEGQVFWKGHFKATGAEKGVNLTINGGEAFAASVWLNGKFVKSTYGKSTYPAYTWPVLDPAIEETDEFFQFPAGSLLAGKDNVLTILHDNMGLNETNDWNAETSKSPRGIRGYKLQGADTTFDLWKVQGKLGGYTDYPDKIRGVLNEGGFYAERAGYHLPALPASVTNTWTSRSPPQGLSTSSPGVGFFRKQFTLDINSSLDAALSFNFKDVGSNPHWRATLWINGWAMGRVVGDMGPQFKFPVQEGILNYDGTNVVAVAIWVLEPGAVKVDVSMAVDAVVEGGIGKVSVVGATSTWQPRMGLV
ncbi:glycoside hydrolase family 35 protein [Tulasnella calospora MUT 4182]|uniref:beta-galactosidase n=1 Tax=Tulasnella calospora MUT 4182 TaxID=1051891 RepID=A0A0C3M2F0_9AGAM|nr:glycoside hydrolase family 35 protein [Tulasnella calospora MUT 4182]